MHVTVDLDDTLVKTQIDYDSAISDLSEWISSETSHSKEEVADILNDIDRDNVNEFGLNAERFPDSFEKTVSRLLDNPSDEDFARAREIALSAYLSPEEYAERGFQEGAKELLETLASQGRTIELLTAGDDEIQQRKIEGLNLMSYFDEISIVGLGGKRDVLRTRIEELSPSSVTHIGNSFSSDVEPAVKAGANVAYIPNAEWRKTDDQLPDLAGDEKVYIYESMYQLIEDLRNSEKFNCDVESKSITLD
jgi:FMN phosphatase YigB (HAD superfamily)